MDLITKEAKEKERRIYTIHQEVYRVNCIYIRVLICQKWGSREEGMLYVLSN